LSASRATFWVTGGVRITGDCRLREHGAPFYGSETGQKTA
jgi:hypothetical protein